MVNEPLVNALDGETAKSVLKEVLAIFVVADAELHDSTCECCAAKRKLLLRLKAVGLVK